MLESTSTDIDQRAYQPQLGFLTSGRIKLSSLESTVLFQSTRCTTCVDNLSSLSLSRASILEVSECQEMSCFCSWLDRSRSSAISTVNACEEAKTDDCTL